MVKTQVNLYVNHANDLQYTLNLAQTNGFDSITTPLANPIFQREFQACKYLLVPFPPISITHYCSLHLPSPYPRKAYPFLAI